MSNGYGVATGHSQATAKLLTESNKSDFVCIVRAHFYRLNFGMHFKFPAINIFEGEPTPLLFPVFYFPTEDFCFLGVKVDIIHIFFQESLPHCNFLSWLPYSRHYNPQFAYFLPTFRRPFLCFQGGFFRKFWHWGRPCKDYTT